MIYIYPIGGLGNMFFHIASIWSLAKDNNDDLCLLNINNKIKDLMNDKRADLKHAPEYQFIFDRFYTASGYISKKHNHTFHYTPIPYIKDCEYFGYYQSEKYFLQHKKEIINLFRPSDNIIQKLNNYSKYFGNISLHVRRNDYVKLYPHIHPPQTKEYYNKALEQLPKDLFVLIFSDDIEWCKENFIGERFVFINEIDYISIFLISKMKYHVIANSSFSWWGAWMSEYKDKIIISPQKWFGDNTYNYVDIIPEEWIKI